MVRFRLGIRHISFLIAIPILCHPATVHGQRTAKKKIPPPETEILSTTDGVQLQCRFYPGTEDKNSVPVILVHAWERSSKDLLALAAHLQKEHGHAVVVPDLRGHGGSTTRRVPGRAELQQLETRRMKPREVQNTYRKDLEAVKKFLLGKHNEGQLNIELLTVLGVEEGAVIAANWAAQDWNWPELPTYKQGQDVKALVLISPPQIFKRMRLQTAFTTSNPDLRSKVSVMLISSQGDSRAAKTAKQLHNVLSRYHEPVPSDREERIKSQDLFLVTIGGQANGTTLTRNARVAASIVEFIDWRLVRRRDLFPWQRRVNPLSGG